MTKVDFHVLTTDADAAQRFACELIEKAYQADLPVYIHTASQAEAEQIDDLLWSFRADSFLPHSLIDLVDDEPPPIQIGYTEQLPAKKHTLVNLSQTIPAFYATFPHIIEIVFSDPIVQQLARDRFKQYRDQGCELTTHKP